VKLAIDETSMALKPEGADDETGGAVEAAVGAAAVMRIASICIGVPRDRLHSMRQPEFAPRSWRSWLKFQRVTGN
jgi:hypothetical protein